MKYILSICAFLFAFDGVAQARALSKALADSPRAYALFDDAGKPVAWPDLVEAAREADVVLFGEYHDDPVMHWLQAELIRDLLAADVRPALGAEMLEADDQLVVDEFLAGWVSDDKLKAAANLWPNHFTDYHPLLELAKVHELLVHRDQRPAPLRELRVPTWFDRLGRTQRRSQGLSSATAGAL